MVLQVVLEVNGQVVLQGKDWILCFLPRLGTLSGLQRSTVALKRGKS